MTIGELNLGREPAGLSTEQENVLDSFATENDLIVPPIARHATHDPLERDIPFIFHQPPVPLAPMRAARGRARLALTVLALLGIAGWGAYVSQSNRPLDLDIIAAWVSRLTSPTKTATMPAAAAPIEAQPNNPTAIDPLPASNQSAVSPAPDRTADTGSNAPAAPQRTGTSGLVAGPVHNVSGAWRLDTQMEASDSSLQGLKLHYEMKLTQDGDRVAGIGTKIRENEKGMPVTMTGTIAGDRLTLNFVELGTETRGKIVLLVDKAGTLRGRFSSSAAQPSGHVEARRVQLP